MRSAGRDGRDANVPVGGEKGAVATALSGSPVQFSSIDLLRGVYHCHGHLDHTGIFLRRNGDQTGYRG